MYYCPHKTACSMQLSLFHLVPQVDSGILGDYHAVLKVAEVSFYMLKHTDFLVPFFTKTLSFVSGFMAQS